LPPHRRKPVSRGFNLWIPAFARMTIFAASCGECARRDSPTDKASPDLDTLNKSYSVCYCDVMHTSQMIQGNNILRRCFGNPSRQAFKTRGPALPMW